MNFQLSKPRIRIKKNKKINTTIIQAINYMYNTNYVLKDFDINKIDKKFF